MATHRDDNHDSDIEKQLQSSTQDDQSSSPSTNMENDNSTTDATATVTTTDSDNDSLSSREKGIIYVLCYTVFFIVILILSPVGMIYVIASICFIGDVKDPNECFSHKRGDGKKPSAQSKRKGTYMKMIDFEPTKQKIQRWKIIATMRAGGLALVWLVVNLCVPSLKSSTLFDCPVWKCSLFCVVLLLGYPIALATTLVITIIISLIIDTILQQTNSSLDYIFGKLLDSIISLVYFMTIILAWLFYFRTNHGLKPSHKVGIYGTWTFVSLFVGSILWVLKSVALLEWKANAVYKRFKGRILAAGFQLYFVCFITDGFYSPWLLPWRNDDKKQEPSRSPNLRFQDYMLSKSVTVDDLDTVARCMTDLALVTLREDDGISEIVAKYQHKIQIHHRSTAEYITNETLEEFSGLNKDDAQLLLQELKCGQMSDEITFDAFQKWVVDAHKNCLSVGYTLIDAFAVISVLNRVISGFIFIVIILMWLLVTGLITTKVLVLIASPFLAFSFVFGDTCKTFFQGIIFSFVTHPYDVGDRCMIDGMELEVKCIAILTTTFVKIGTKEDVLYPNTSLATKVIINLKGEPDPSDMIELILDSSTTKSKILSLKKDLERFFESNDQRHSYEKTIHVAVKEIGSSIKLSISFIHVMNVQDVSHSQCLQKKNKQRSELLIDIKQFLEDQEIKLAPSIFAIMTIPK